MGPNLDRQFEDSGGDEHIAHQAHHTAFSQATGKLNAHLAQLGFAQKPGQAPHQHLGLEARQGLENSRQLPHRFKVKQGLVGVAQPVLAQARGLEPFR